MSALWAVPGAKCVCVDNFHADDCPPVLVVGAVYEVAEVVLDDGRGVTGPYKGARVGVVLVGVENPYDWRFRAFAAARFRPIISRTQAQDLELFAPLLTVVGEPA